MQTIQHKLAEVKTDTAMARCFTDRAMQMYEEGNLDYTTASMSKVKFKFLEKLKLSV